MSVQDSCGHVERRPLMSAALRGACAGLARALGEWLLRW